VNAGTLTRVGSAPGTARPLRTAPNHLASAWSGRSSGPEPAQQTYPSGRAVRDRRADETPLDALHRHLRSGLDRRDPITGLCDIPQVVAFYRLILDTPALGGALVRYQTRGEQALTSALMETTATGPQPELTARLAAIQVLAVFRALADGNQRRISAGHRADELAPEAFAEADHAFDLLRGGLAAYAERLAVATQDVVDGVSG
jgi:hypothetical protein